MAKHTFIRTVRVLPKDLPICCPQDNEPLWCSHPKVYFPAGQGEVSCYYCSTRYVVVADDERTAPAA